jgi:hypothetical protein
LYLARSVLADEFLKWSHSRTGGGRDDDVYFSFDDDTEFRLEDAKAVVGSILSGRSHFSGGSYAERSLNPLAFRAACADAGKSYEECIEDAAPHYCGNIPVNHDFVGKQLRGFKCLGHQFIEADWVGGGFFAMSRAAIEALMSAYPGMMLFDNAVNKDGIWQSDDIVIGQRFKAIGGQSYLDISTRLVHWGSFGYRSALDRHLAELGFTVDNQEPRETQLDTRVHIDALRNARNVGIKLRYRREHAGLTQEALADAMSVPPSYIARVETDEIELTAGQLQQWLALCPAPVL